MADESPKPGPAGSTDQWPHWEGPQENTPRGYMPAKDDPETDRDTKGENDQDPKKTDVGEAGKTRDNL